MFLFCESLFFCAVCFDVGLCVFVVVEFCFSLEVFCEVEF